MLQTNFQLMEHHNYALSDIENMLPWERQVYIGLVVEHTKKQNEESKELEAKFPKK
jgi:hypothetical protein